MVPPLARRFASAVAALTLAVGTIAAPVVAIAEGKDAEAQKLSETREAQRYNVAMPGASIRAGGAAIYVNAPMAVVKKVVTDYAHYATFMPRFQQSRVVAKKDGKTDVYLQVPIVHGAATVWSLTRFEPPTKEGSTGERVEGKMIEGNVDDFRAVWHLRPVNDTHTVLKAELLIVPKLPLPGSVITPELEYAADQAVTSARDRAESKVKEGAQDGTAQKLASGRSGSPPRRLRRPLRGARERTRESPVRLRLLGPALLFVPVVVGCRSNPSSLSIPREGSLPVASAPAHSSESVPPAEAPAPAMSAGRRRDGCWGIGLSSDPAARLRELHRRCAEGFFDLLPLTRLTVDGTEDVALPPMAPGACLRAGAVAPGGGAEITLLAGGATLAADADAAFSLVSPEGPLCPKGAQPLSLRVRRLSGGGPVWVQAWSSVAPLTAPSAEVAGASGAASAPPSSAPGPAP